ncbi:MAG: prolyl oligopeptidase family serine peptidase [Verrucomicrobiales bacterium]|nr:prolyl oligopeptidase family serine peptidase [Verrucomicrobiales bacterium]
MKKESPRKRLLIHLCLPVLLFTFSSGLLAEEYRILPPGFNADKENQMMRAYQRQQVHTALDARLAELETALGSPASLAAYQQRRRDFLARTFGPLPKRCPLKAETTGVIQRDGYRIEKVIFESFPDYHVTANLYCPDTSQPCPGILLPCGHSANGKAYESYQKAAILLVQNGFVVLCFDPVGQGERRQLIGETPHPILKPKGEHNEIGVAPILLGRTLGSMMVWDGIRAIDYLCSRAEVDPDRIGCTGNSGGGNLTSYLMAFDERITAAAPGCFMTTHRRKNEKPGPGDAEQNLFAQIRDGFDHPDFILARAPKPTLILSATHDYVPIAGAWEAYRQAKRFYTVSGYPERVDLIETNDKHGFSRRLREGAVRFMARWLQDRNIDVFETEEVPVLSDQDLQVTEHGQVRWHTGSRSVFDLYKEMEADLAENRPPLTKEIVRDVTGIRALENIPMPTLEKKSGTTPQKWVLQPEPGISIPALYWPEGKLTPVLLTPAKGMNSAVPEALRLQKAGHPALVIEVRDTGETKTQNWRFFGADFYIGQMLGRSWLAMRTEDILSSARWFSKTANQTLISLQADGEIDSAALHARFLEPELISDLTTKGGLPAWRTLMTDREARKYIHQAVHGALQYYDLPDLVK